MNQTVKFDNQTEFLAVEVDNKAIYRDLTTKLESKHPAISQQHPGEFFGPRILVSHLTGPLQRFFAEWLHGASDKPSPGPSGHPLPEGEGLDSRAIA